MWMDKILAVLRNKKLWFRALFTLAIIGVMSYVILSDMSCHYKNFSCDSKSKVNIDVKK